LTGIEKVRLQNNGISDEGLCCMLRGVHDSQEIKKLDLIGNIVGDLSIIETANILSKASNIPFQELVLSNLKIGAGNLNILLELLANCCSLSKLVLERMPFNEISIDLVSKIAKKGKSLYYFSIAGGELLGCHVVTILKGIAKNKLLEYIDLSWITLGSQGEMFVTEVKNEISSLLCNIIIRNKQLIHLDLSYSRLVDEQIKLIIESLKKSNSVLSVHLTGNGITSAGKKLIVDELKCETLKVVTRSDFMPDHFENSVGISRENSHQIDNLNTNDQSEIASIYTKKRKNEKLTKDEPLILWRIKSTSAVHLGNHKWVLCDQCYICEKWKLTAFIFCKEIANAHFEAEKNVIMNETIKSKQAEYKDKKHLPFLMTELFKYDPIYLLPMQEFFEILDPGGIVRISSRNLLTQLENHTGKVDYNIPTEFIKQIPSSVMLYLGLAMLPPKKHDIYYCDSSNNLYTNMIIVQPSEKIIRAEAAPPIKKKQRIFIKEKSVFKFWKDDTPGLLAKMLEFDFNKSKIKKFVKNQFERNEIFDIFKQYILHLKEEFASQIVKSTYPSISWIDFTTYCQQKNIIDKQITLSVIDRLFIAVNVDIEASSQGQNNDRTLCRYEFFEILIRIAGAKYKDTGLRKTYKESVELLLESLINLNDPPQIRLYRINEIWTLPIDDLLRSNIEGLRKIYCRFIHSQKKFMSLPDCIQLIRKDCGFDISEFEITRAYGYSKMTIINEYENFLQYKQMVFEEFLEFIVRISSVIYPDLPDRKTTLQQKVDRLLVSLLGIIHTIKHPPHVPDESESEGEQEENNEKIVA